MNNKQHNTQLTKPWYCKETGVHVYVFWYCMTFMFMVDEAGVHK